jgi:hypothetical protein
MAVIQKHSSAATSLNQVPALHKRFVDPSTAMPVVKPGLVLDYGGGRYDTASAFLADHGYSPIVYDPFNRSNAHNEGALQIMRDRGPQAVLMANVLNVIDSEENYTDTLEHAASFAAPLFISCYEGDRMGEGFETKKGWQRNETLTQHFNRIDGIFPNRIVKRIGNVIIVYHRRIPADYKGA